MTELMAHHFPILTAAVQAKKIQFKQPPAS
jgi:hypothetical protein